ncbi:MAG: type IX secretion system anionic LPS delivery protein PorZ [Luteibaculaceae bacterium]
MPLSILLTLLCTSVFSQMRIGEWRDHLAYVQGTGVTSSGSKIYTTSNSGVFVFDQTDNSLERLSKVNSLSDVNVTSVYASELAGLLVVGYQSGNIDLIFGRNTVNMPDVVRANITGSKTINNFTAHNNLLYVSAGFGIFILDPFREEIRNTFFIGPNSGTLNVRNVTVFNNAFWAVTENGLFRAPSTGANLANFQNWIRQTGLPPNSNFTFSAKSDNSLYVVERTNTQGDFIYKLQENTWENVSIPGATGAQTINDFRIQNNQLIITLTNRVVVLTEDEQIVRQSTPLGDGLPFRPMAATVNNNTLWVADNSNGLIAFNPNNTTDFIAPNGPFYADAYRISVAGDYVYVASGGVNEAWNSVQNRLGYYYLTPENKWISVNNRSIDWFDLVMDILYVLPNPRNPRNHFVASYFSGLFEFEGEQFITRHWAENSTLRNTPTWSIWTGIPFAMFDSSERMWVTNNRVAEPISVRLPNGTWQSFGTGGLITGDIILSDIIETRSGHLWILSPKLSNTTRGILVFDHNNTIENRADDRYILLNNIPGRGGLQGDVFCFKEDLNGVIWVGTDQGIEVFFNPAAAFNGNINAQRILIEQDGNIQFLLVTETINAIEVDGGNRKWVATQRSGVFLFSEDGQRQLRHFTSENSPLPSDNVFDIKINPRNGEVFFATEAGIVSYMGDATFTGDDEFGKIEVYPNPVNPGFDGVIAMRGFALNSDVRVTDVAGNVVFQTRANGGQAIWDGRNLKGEQVPTGVYLVFGSDREGERTAVGKVLFVR